jgi:hypothetical protein
MWHVDGTRNSLITAGNAGTGPTHAAVTLFYNKGKGSYTIEKQIEPGEQIWADVGDLIRNQVPDKNGKTIPRDVMMGSYELRDLDHIGVGYLYEGKLVIDKTWGHGYYGCAGCCGYEGQRLLPNPFAGGVGTQGNNTAESEDMCSESWVDLTSEAYDWASTNSGIVNLPNATSHFMSPGTVTGSTQIQLQRQLAREDCPVEGFEPQNTQNAKPSITWNGSVIDSTTQSVVVGEEISLSGSPGNGTWSVTGNIVGGFEAGSSGGPLTLASMSGTDILFYWVAGGSETVTYTVSGASASATFSVAAPSYSGITVSVAGPSIVSSGGVQYLRLQGGTQPGISMTASVQAPSGHSGTLSWAQIINGTTITLTPGAGGPVTCSIAPQSLDNAYPYSNVYQSGTNAQDSPGVSLNSQNVRTEDSFSFTMYLQWTPAGVSNPIGVPLANVSWQADIVANYSSGSWGTSSPSATYSVKAPSPPVFPSWTQTYTNGNMTCGSASEESSSLQFKTLTWSQ